MDLFRDYAENLSFIRASVEIFRAEDSLILRIEAHFAFALTLKLTWVRDHYFPPSYAQATWRRLLPFFQLPGTITQDATLVQVELRPFNDRVPNRDLALLGDRVHPASPRLPDGRRLSFPIRPCRCPPTLQRA